MGDYSHWNEEAAIVKAQEDRYSDYYRDEPDYNESMDAPEDEDEDEDEEFEYERRWATEDSALESSLFGDC